MAGYKTLTKAGRDAPWLTMVHGMSQDHRTFSAQVSEFKDRYRILLIDLPGHGLSADVPGPFGHHELASHVAAAMEHAGAVPTHYWGTHTGAALGLLLASRDRARFLSLVLEGAVLPGYTLPSVSKELEKACSITRADGVAAARRRWFDDSGWFEVIRARPEECRAGGQWSIVSGFSGAPWLHEGQAAAVDKIDERLKSLEVPVLLYNGEHDLEDFVATADRLERLLPVVRRRCVPEAGGFPAWEFPDRVNAMVAEFLIAPGTA